MKILLLVFSLFPLMLFSQINDTLYDVTSACMLYKNMDDSYTIEVDSHTINGPKGDYTVVKAVMNDKFLNVYCLTNKYNFLLILTSEKKNNIWEHYASFQILFPKFDVENEVKKMEFPDIHTLYIVYETKKNGLVSYVVRLVDDRYAIYQYLNDPFINSTDLNRYEFPTIKGRPKF